MGEVATELFVLLARAHLLGHVAQHASQQRGPPELIAFAASTRTDPLRVATGLDDSKMDLAFLAAGGRLFEHPAHGLDVVGMHLAAQIPDLQRIVALQSEDLARRVGGPDAPPVEIPHPEAESR